MHIILQNKTNHLQIHVAEYDALMALLSPPAGSSPPGDAPSPPSPSPAAKTMWQRFFGG
jgi:hypothetical protein